MPCRNGQISKSSLWTMNTWRTTSVGYVGFVGILIAVRWGLSISLNFLLNRNSTSFIANVSLNIHQILILLGFRPSIASILWQHFCSHDCQDVSLPVQSSSLATIALTAAYIALGDGESVLIIEKDQHSADLREAENFLVMNHDVLHEEQRDLDAPPRLLGALPSHLEGCAKRRLGIYQAQARG